MGLPSINIVFKEQGVTAIQRGQRGIVVLILKDTVPEKNPIEASSEADIPTTLSDKNKEQIRLALIGYQNHPKKVIAYIIAADVTDYSDVQEYLETIKWNYIAVPEIAEGETMSFATWIKGLRDNKGLKVKAVLPNCAADHEGIINFATEKIVTRDKEYTTAEYCGRIAGLIAGTPLTISATFAPLSEVIDCDKKTKAEFDVAINEGKFLLYNDGEKVKVARAVNSLTTKTDTKKDSFKKIKIVDIMDMINDDIKKTAEDNYLGKYNNSYDNKCVLITAIQNYFEQLELEGVLDTGKNKIELDMDAQIKYLKDQEIDVENMTEKEIKEANTGDKVFLAANIKILDAIEEIELPITI